MTRLIYFILLLAFAYGEDPVEPLPEPEALSFLKPVFLTNPFRQSAERRTDVPRNTYRPPRRRFPVRKIIRPFYRQRDPAWRSRKRTRPALPDLKYTESKFSEKYRPRAYAISPSRSRIRNTAVYGRRAKPRRAVHGSLESALNYLWSYKKVAYDNLFSQSEALKGISQNYGMPLALPLVSSDPGNNSEELDDKEELLQILEDIWKHRPTLENIQSEPTSGSPREKRSIQSAEDVTADAWSPLVKLVNEGLVKATELSEIMKSVSRNQNKEGISRIGLADDDLVAEITFLDDDDANTIVVPVKRIQGRLGQISQSKSQRLPHHRQTGNKNEDSHSPGYLTLPHRTNPGYPPSGGYVMSAPTMKQKFRHHFITIFDSISKRLPSLGKAITVMSFMAFSVFVANLGVNSFNANSNSVFVGRELGNLFYSGSNIDDLIFRMEELLTSERFELPESEKTIEKIIESVAKEVYVSVEKMMDTIEEETPASDKVQTRYIIKKKMEEIARIKSQNPKCYRKELCLKFRPRNGVETSDNMKYIPFWTFGVTWLKGEEGLTELLEDLRAELAGLVSKNCTAIFPECAVSPHNSIPGLSGKEEIATESTSQNSIKTNWIPLKLIVTADEPNTPKVPLTHWRLVHKKEGIHS